MDFLITYSLKSIFCMSIFYLVYNVFLRKETFFKLNRIILLSSLIFSIILPFLKFTFYTEKIPKIYTYTLSAVNVFANKGVLQNESKFSLSSIILIFIASVSFLFLINFILQITKIFKLRNTSKILIKKDYKIAFTDKEISPFTFFRTMFLNKEEKSQEVINHELIHIKHFHSIDIIIIEILKIFLWFNPFIYLFKRLITESHEYIADKEVVERGTNKSNYIISILKHILIRNDIYLINNFSKSLIKRRFKMLNKKRTNKIFSLKALIVIPVSVFLVFVIACTNKKQEELINNSETDKTLKTEIQKPVSPKVETKNDSVYIVVETFPIFPNGDEGRLNYISNNIKYPKEAREKGIQGTVYVQFIIEADGSATNPRILRGIGHGCDKEVLRLVENMPKWIPGKQNGKAVRLQFNMPIKFTLN